MLFDDYYNKIKVIGYSLYLSFYFQMKILNMANFKPNEKKVNKLMNTLKKFHFKM
jgi:hypothetical protein